jgi:hypothetical protein
MKALIKVGHSVKMQAKAFNSVDSNDAIEIEVEVKDENELMEKYEHFQKLIREKSIKNVMESAKEFMKKRAAVFDKLDAEDD